MEHPIKRLLLLLLLAKIRRARLGKGGGGGRPISPPRPRVFLFLNAFSLSPLSRSLEQANLNLVQVVTPREYRGILLPRTRNGSHKSILHVYPCNLLWMGDVIEVDVR